MVTSEQNILKPRHGIVGLFLAFITSLSASIYLVGIFFLFKNVCYGNTCNIFLLWVSGEQMHRDLHIRE